MINFNPARITGTKINYYFICQRKLWLFSRDISMKQTSGAVAIGKLIHEQSYERANKELMIDETIKIDFVGKDKVIHEVKKAKSMEKAHRYQMYYYLYYLKNKGVENLTGCLHYPKLKKKEDVFLDAETEAKLEEVLIDIRRIDDQAKPPPKINKKFCKKCSYFELCYC